LQTIYLTAAAPLIIISTRRRHTGTYLPTYTNQPTYIRHSLTHSLPHFLSKSGLRSGLQHAASYNDTNLTSTARFLPLYIYLEFLRAADRQTDRQTDTDRYRHTFACDGMLAKDQAMQPVGGGGGGKVLF
jgi:hypothetical protein